MERAAPSDGPLRLALVAGAWLALAWGMLQYGALALPRSIARELTLQTFLMIAQVAMTGAGLGLALGLLAEPRAALGLARPTARQLTLVALATPAVFVASFAAGVGIALPTLMAELANRGTEATRQDLGELGRAVKEAPAWLTLTWGALMAPVAEELLFRGAIWSAIRRLAAPAAPFTAPAEPEDASAPGPPASSELPAIVFEDGLMVRAGRRVWAVLRHGGFATLGSAAIFGAMHLGVPGGAGIVRVVSATCLGLACGAARHATGSVVAALALHVAYNVLSIAQTRRWLVTASLPSKYGMPTALAIGAAVLGIAALAVWRAGRTAPSPEGAAADAGAS